MKRSRTPLFVGLVTAVALLSATPFAVLHAAPRTPVTCLPKQLGVRSNGIRGTAGTIHGAWVFTNLSKTACTLKGYPDMQLFGRAGRTIRTDVRDSLSPGPSLVTIAPSASATFRSSYSDVASDAKPCPTSAVAAIIPTKGVSLYIPAVLGPCRGVMNVSAVMAGIHHP